MDKKRKIGFNIVDMVIVLIVAAALVFGVHKLRGSSIMAAKTTHHVTFTVLCEEQPKELYDNISAILPSTIMASGALYDGAITAVERSPFLVCAAHGEWVEDPLHENLIFTIEGTFEDTDVRMNTLGKQELRIGRSYIVKSEYIEIDKGTILSMEWDQ